MKYLWNPYTEYSRNGLDECIGSAPLRAFLAVLFCCCRVCTSLFPNKIYYFVRLITRHVLPPLFRETAKGVLLLCAAVALAWLARLVLFPWPHSWPRACPADLCGCGRARSLTTIPKPIRYRRLEWVHLSKPYSRIRRIELGLTKTIQSLFWIIVNNCDLYSVYSYMTENNRLGLSKTPIKGLKTHILSCNSTDPGWYCRIFTSILSKFNLNRTYRRAIFPYPFPVLDYSELSYSILFYT